MASKKWAGFTDEDIEKMKLNPIFSENSTLDEASLNALKLASAIKDVSEEEVALKNSPTSCKLPRDTWKVNKSDNSSSSNDCTCNHIGYTTEYHEMASNYDEAPNDESIRFPTDCQDLEAFELRQKHIEAENARRRALISKAITDKKEKTQAEAIKLSHITDELNRLDNILSSDIVILRDYIEKASREFSQAEKRYLKAEKEFIEAKFFLFEKMQRKEQLTEHLCAIIEQNENRKASKLVELMKQLEMETVVEDFEMPEMKPILSKYCVANEEVYRSCQTFKPSLKNSVQEFKNNRTDDSKDEASDEGSQPEAS
ncbi:RAB6-interacting golgin [Parasteatoda tepidariorum]|nr:RAB6-interacting golgin [Parasteatoda tepidariorum]